VKKDEYYDYALEAYRPAETLIKMVPVEKLDWKPGPAFMTLGQLICHLSGGIGGELSMVINKSWPKMEDMDPAKMTQVSCNVDQALANLEKDKTTLREALAGISEKDFAEKVVSTPWGWEFKMEKMALNFRDHFITHKMQLFTYLKLLGFPVNTETLYMG
jgi:hypothetical protein